jgi:hypothetical protein
MPHLKAQDPEWPQKDQLPDDLNEYVRDLGYGQKEVLRAAIKIDPNDRRAFVKACETYRDDFVTAIGHLNSYQQKLDCDLDTIREALSQALSGHSVQMESNRPQEAPISEPTPSKRNSWIKRLFGARQD